MRRHLRNLPQLLSKARSSLRYGVGATSVLALLLSLSCSKSKKTEPEATTPPPAADQGWAGKMHSLSETLSDLLPLVASRTKFNDEKNHARIEGDTRRLRQLAHGLSQEKAPIADPSMKMMSGLFAEDIDRALESLKTGNREYSRQILKDTTSYCIQCHTQTNNGPEFPRLDLKINLAELSPLEQAEFFAATRQFDRALSAYDVVLKSENLAKADPFEWEQSARAALAIIVRVKHDPKAASQLISTIESNKAISSNTKGILASWKKSVREWSNEKKPVLVSPNEKITHAEELIKRAQNREEFPLDHSQDILYFRASSLLHDLLATRGRTDPLSAQALYLAGVAAEATRDMNFWTLHETLYESCIHAAPHSALAMKCWTQLSDSITLGYSGSGGVRIPPDVSRRLETLKTQAKPQ